MNILLKHNLSMSARGKGKQPQIRVDSFRRQRASASGNLQRNRPHRRSADRNPEGPGQFPEPGVHLRPGQFARVRVAVAEKENAILVPARAIQELPGAKTVLVVDAENIASLRTISVGDKSDKYLVVLEGLKAGERGYYDLICSNSYSTPQMIMITRRTFEDAGETVSATTPKLA